VNDQRWRYIGRGEFTVLNLACGLAIAGVILASDTPLAEGIIGLLSAVVILVIGLRCYKRLKRSRI
jgi:hypothetical protein